MNHKTNLGIRAVLHTARKWKKTLLVFFLLLAITTLVMSGLAIADAQEEQSEELRGVTGASFTVNANNGYTLQPVTDEMIEEIAAIDGVESYNTSQYTIANLYNQDTLMKGTDEREYVSDLFYAIGCFDSEYSPLFLSGALRLTEGRHVTEGNSGIILYEGLAEKYGLSLGDTLEIKNGNPDDPLVECEIAGLFEVIADGDDEQATMAKPSTLFDYKDYVFVNMDTMSAVSAPYTVSEGNGIDSVDFFVSDAAKLESIVQEVQNSTSIDWNSYYVTVNNEVYERISSSIADTTTLVTTLIVVITVVSMVLIILILSMSIRSRKRETGILLAIGIAKPAVILQYVLETLLIAVVAFPLAYLSSKQVAGTLGTLFGKTAENVIGKMTYSNGWKFVAVVPASEAAIFKEGATETFSFAAAAGKETSVTVERIITEENAEKAVVIFSGMDMDNDFLTMRFENPRVQTVSYSGIVIPKEAVRIRTATDEEGNTVQEKVVYAMFGNSARARSLDIIYEDDDVIISNATGQSGYISAYDQVIIKGKELNDAEN